jgi:hypothetical protein
MGSYLFVFLFAVFVVVALAVMAWSFRILRDMRRRRKRVVTQRMPNPPPKSGHDWTPGRVVTGRLVPGEGRLIVDDISDLKEMSPEKRKAAMDWYTKEIPGLDHGKVQTFPAMRISHISATDDGPPGPGVTHIHRPLGERHYGDAAPVGPQKHPSIQTRYGALFDLIEPHPGSVDLDDIAWTCAREGRFGNRTKDHYSVAQHQVMVTPVLWALEWDAGPVVVKAMKRLKERLDKVILQRFNLEPLNHIHPMNEFISDADRQLLLWERDRFMEKPGGLWDVDEEKLPRLTAEDFGLHEESPLLAALPSDQAYPLYWNMMRRLTRGWGLVGGLAENADLSDVPELDPALVAAMDQAFDVRERQP